MRLMLDDNQELIPSALKKELNERLLSDEIVVIAMNINLDAGLNFGEGFVVLTNHRILSRSPYDEAWSEWTYAEDLRMTYHEYGGIGYLELFNDRERLACWRMTRDQKMPASRLMELFRLRIKNYVVDQSAASQEYNYCPECKAVLNLDATECPYCLHSSYQLTSPKILWRLWRFAKPYKWTLLIGMLFMLLSTAVSLIPPYLMMPIMDNILIPAQQGQAVNQTLIVLYLSGLLGASLAAWGLSWFKSYLLSKISERIGTDLRIHTYDHLLKLSFEYFASMRTGDLISRISTQSDRVSSFLSGQLLDFITDFLMMLMIVPTLFTIDPQMACVSLISFPLIAFIIHLIREKLRVGYDKIDRAWSHVANILVDTIPGIRVVKAFVQEKREIQRFKEANEHNYKMNNHMNKTVTLFSPTLVLVNDFGLLALWAFGIYQVIHGQIKVGVLTAFIAYTGRFFSRIESMGRIVSGLQRTVAATRRIFDILDHPVSVTEATAPVPLGKLHGDIELRHVFFRYDSRFVSRNINLHIKAGEMIGVVGHSGAGKSTLINLICRFYDLTEGDILIDGQDIRSFAIADYRRQIGLVPQEPFLFYGTIAENIAYGRPDATPLEIVNAARAARAHEFIMRLPLGYDSLVGERGQSLSGGERQRLSIARALLLDPAILILDEATASVDSETEHDIQIALENLVKGRTTIAIAHRLSTLHRADRIVVLEHGQIVEVGPHHELLHNKNAYYHLYNLQANNFIIDI